MHSKHRCDDLDENSERDCGRVSSHYEEAPIAIWKTEPIPPYVPTRNCQRRTDLLQKSKLLAKRAKSSDDPSSPPLSPKKGRYEVSSIFSTNEQPEEEEKQEAPEAAGINNKNNGFPVKFPNYYFYFNIYFIL